MRYILRIPESSWTTLQKDLHRPHPHAAERIGFLFTKLAPAQDSQLLLAYEYWSVPDEWYEEDSLVGARIGNDAIRYIMSAAFKGKAEHVGVLHVHAHYGFSRLAFSSTDLSGLPDLAKSLQSASPQAVHGALLCNEQTCKAVILPPKERRLQVIDQITIVGNRFRFWWK